MSRRLKLIIALILGIILGILFVLGLRGARQSGSGADQDASGIQRQTSAATPPALQAAAPVLTEKQRGELAAELSLEILARAFAERYGSYSNQNQFENVKELYPFMTEALRTRLAQTIVQAQASTPEAVTSYAGVTTKAMSVEVLERTESGARVRVQTQRKEVRAGEAAPKLYYRILKLNFVKADKQWKADQVEWE